MIEFSALACILMVLLIVVVFQGLTALALRETGRRRH